MSGPVELPVLAGIDLEIEKGEMLAIVGASGVGKSTFLHVLGGLERPTGGRVLHGDVDLYALQGDRIALFRNRHIGFIFQFHHLLPEFTALENVMMPVLIGGARGEEAARLASMLLGDVGLGTRLHHRPGELSGGEQQRVAVARALVLDPDVVLADEPTGNLDIHTGETIHELLRKINREKKVTFVVVTHNDQLAMSADRIFRMVDGTLHREH